MKKQILTYSILCTILCTFFSQSGWAQFPYTETFKNTTAPGVVFGGEASSFLTAGIISGDINGTGYLRLTNDTNFQKGFAYGNTEFPTRFGLKASFEYFTYGGDGADGICFFLFDATAAPFNIGSFGGSLGYAQFNSPVSAGVSKGYLGIGLDEFGNFSNPTEGRQGGPGFEPSAVVLRGKGDGSSAVATNYPYLTSVQTTSLASPFHISGGSTREPLPSSLDYRRADIELKPRTGGGYEVTVKITTGGPSPTSHTVISAYPYTTVAPSNLKFGFAASTGGSRNYHEIRNLTIEVYDTTSLLKPTAKDTAVAACYGNPLNFNILSNAILPNMPQNADSASVRFITPGTGVKTNSLTIAGMGTFYADTSFGSKGIVTFTPATGFSGTVTPVQYTFKDNYGQQATPAMINVTVKAAITNNIISPSGTLHTYNGTLPNGGNGSYTYQWQSSTTDSVNGFTNAAGSSTGPNYTAAPISVVTWYRRVVTSNGCPVYSNVIGVAASGVPLSLELLSFSASRQEDKVLISWETANEKNIQEFTVEKSLLAAEWATAGTITAKGYGKYNYTDDNPSPGMSYYRLKMLDINKKSTYSSISRVQMPDLQSVLLYPNPVTDKISLSVSNPADISRIELSDISSRIVRSMPVMPYYDMSPFPAGLYVLTLYYTDGHKKPFLLEKK